MKTKICTKCKRELPLDRFYVSVSKQTKSGLRTDSYCKKCKIKRSHYYAIKNIGKRDDEQNEILKDLMQDEEFRSLMINMGK
jgi:hypothetical protein